MSLSYTPLTPVLVRDPITDISQERFYSVLKSGKDKNYSNFASNNISNSQIQFNCNPPMGNCFVDPKWYVGIPIRLTMTGTAPVGELLLNPGQDAPRQFPIASGTNALKVSINNEAVSINISDIVHAMQYFNSDEHLKQGDYSMSPSYPDQAQQYSSTFMTNRSPLSFYGDSGDEGVVGRAGFPFTIVSNTNTTAVVDMYCCEPLWISPLYWGKGNSNGFVNVSTIDVTFTFLSAFGNRAWSHDAVSSGIQTTISSITASFNNFSPAFSYADNTPQMFINFITPQDVQVIPWNLPITYPYFNVVPNSTDLGNVASNATVNAVSNNLQLSNIPNRVFIYIRETNNDLYSTPNNPDTFFSIETLSVKFNNKTGIFSSANKRQLYEMSVKNGCTLSWAQWSGLPLYSTGSFSTTYSGVGSILCFEFGSDLPLDSLEAPGKDGQYQLQVQMTAINRSNRTINATMYIVYVNEGTFVIPKLGEAKSYTGVISSADILYAQRNPFIDYKDVEQVQGSGNFLSSLKHFGKDVGKALKVAAPHILPTVKEAVSIAKDAAPLLAMAAGNGCDCPMNYGQGVLLEGMGSGVSVGGRRLKRSAMRKRDY